MSAVGPIDPADVDSKRVSNAPAKDFGRRWRSGAPPAIDDFLAERGVLSASELAAVARIDLRERWLRGERPDAAEYLQRYPQLSADGESAIDVIYAEFLVREELGERCDACDFQRRFPAYADTLIDQVRLHQSLESEDHSPTESATGETAEVESTHARVRQRLEADYEVLHEIGRGGMGIVFKAKQVGLNRLVALKMLRPSDAENSELLARFRAEAKVVASLRHPQIVQIYDYGEHDGSPFLALELVEGGTLAARLDGTPWRPRNAASLVAELARTVHFAHQRGIVHRDLKPANLLIASGGVELEVKITDFGLAKVFGGGPSSQTQSCAVVGTPSYMPPERAAGDSTAATKQGDVYSLGAILYELLTGRPPFLGATVFDTLSMIRDREPIALQSLQPHTPRDLATICHKCLAKSPEARYDSAQELADDLARFLAGEPICARRPALYEIVFRWCRRKPAVAGLAACLLATAVAGFMGVVWQWRQAELARQSENLARLDADERTREVGAGLQRLKLANAFLERGRAHRAARNWDDADAAFTRAIELRPDHIQAWETRGEQVYVRLGLWDLAAADFAQAFELQQPNTSARWWWNALFRAYLDDTDGYRKVCASMLQHSSHHPATPLGFEQVRALCLNPQQEVNIGRLVELADAMATANPNNSIFLYLQGLVAYRAGLYDLAVARCQASLQSESEDFPKDLNYPILALALHELHRNEQAKAALDQAESALERWTQQRCSVNSDSWVTTLGASDDWPISPFDWLEFETFLRQAYTALDLAPADDPRLVLLRARALAGLRRPDAAQQAYARALEGMPDDVQVQLEAHRHAAYYHAGRKEFQQAAAEFARAGELRPDDCRLAGFCALTQLAAGDIDAYRAKCADMMHRFGDTRDQSVAHELVEACTLRPDALPDMSLLLPLAELASTSYLGSIRVLGAARYRAGQPSAAVQCFDKASALSPPRPLALAFQAMAHQSLGDMAKAHECLADATRWVELANQPDPNDLSNNSPSWGGWYERVNVPIVLSEALALIERPAPHNRK